MEKSQRVKKKRSWFFGEKLGEDGEICAIACVYRSATVGIGLGSREGESLKQATPITRRLTKLLSQFKDKFQGRLVQPRTFRQFIHVAFAVRVCDTHSRGWKKKTSETKEGERKRKAQLSGLVEIKYFFQTALVSSNELYYIIAKSSSFLVKKSLSTTKNFYCNEWGSKICDYRTPFYNIFIEENQEYLKKYIEVNFSRFLQAKCDFGSQIS